MAWFTARIHDGLKSRDNTHKTKAASGRPLNSIKDRKFFVHDEDDDVEDADGTDESEE
jgi:hypothetical protein